MTTRNERLLEEIILFLDGHIKNYEDEKGAEEYWLDTSLVRIYDRVDIDDDKIKIMKDYGVAYDHSI